MYMSWIIAWGRSIDQQQAVEIYKHTYIHINIYNKLHPAECTQASLKLTVDGVPNAKSSPFQQSFLWPQQPPTRLLHGHGAVPVDSGGHDGWGLLLAGLPAHLLVGTLTWI